MVLANAGTPTLPKPVTLNTAATEPPKFSVPVASNIGKAPLKIATSDTIAVTPDGAAQPVPPLEIPKGVLGKPEQVVKANDAFSLKGRGNRVVATYVMDGDTFQFQPVGPQNIQGMGDKFVCRIDSIDTPEKKFGPKKVDQPYGPQASEKLKQMIENKEVDIFISKNDQYGRNICQVEFRGAGVDHELVKAGMAWVYNRWVRENPFDPRKAPLQDAELDARRNQIGLWSDPNPMAPSLFRQLNR